MHRPILTCAFLLVATVAFAQQQQPAESPSDGQQAAQPAAQSGPYQGQSNPPADDAIVTAPPEDVQPKPKSPAGKPATVAPAQATDLPAANADMAAPAKSVSPAETASDANSVDSSANRADSDVTGTDDGIVGVAKEEPQDAAGQETAGQEPVLRSRTAADPDGDIVHPHPLAPGELADGTTIRVHLLTRLSTVDSRPGEVFRTQVASDVVQDGQVLIPAGAEIDGRVVQVESGTSSSHGTMLLRPDTVILLDGSRFRMDGQVTGAPGTGMRIDGEGYVNPGSRYKKDGVKYGAGVGAGVVTGALVAGPVGAVTGGIIGAGAITLHLLTKHSDATLEPGTVLLFTLDSRLNLSAAAPSTGN